MTTATMKARIVRVKIEEGKTGLFYATSPDLKGMLVAEPTINFPCRCTISFLFVN